VADDQLLPSHFSSFDETPLPAHFSSFDEDAARAPSDAAVGTGLSGIPAAPATLSDVGHYAAAGGHELGATAAGFAASIAPGPESEEMFHRMVEQQQAEAEESRAAATPTAQPGLGHPMLWAAEQLPGMAPYAAAATTGPLAPAAMAAVGAAQTRGDVYNRLKAQGIEPTSDQLTVATALGAAQGLGMEFTSGLASAAVAKKAVSPIVGRALGLSGDSVVFGAGSAAEEYAGQKAEQAAGKRTDLDVGAITGAGVSGAEFGAVFGAPHLIAHGLHDVVSKPRGEGQAKTQTGGEASVGRRTPEQAAAEAKPRAPGGGAEAEPDAKGPAPPAKPTDDPTLVAGATEQFPAPDATGWSVTAHEPSPAEAPAPVPAPEAVRPPEQPAPQVTPEVTSKEAAPPTAPAEPPARLPEPEQIVPESEETLRQQHADLVDSDSPRKLMVYNPGMEPFPLPKGPFATLKLPDGRMAQYRYDKGGLSKEKIISAVKNDRLNELLQMGSTSKDEAIQDAVAGRGQPAAVVERTPQGTEVKSAAGTTATAPTQAAELEAAKTPGNVVGVEPVDQAPRERMAAAGGAPEVETPEVTPRVTPPAVRTAETDPELARVKAEMNAQLAARAQPGRVLADLSPEAPAIRATADTELQRTVQEQLKQRQREREAATGGKEKKPRRYVPEIERPQEGRKAGEEELARKAGDNAAADRIAAEYSPEGAEPHGQTFARAQAMVRDAKEQGLTIPREAAEHHSPGMAMLMEARDFVSRTKQYPDDRLQHLGAFLDREAMLRKGDLDQWRAVRRAEGAEASAIGTREAGATKEIPDEITGREGEETPKEEGEGAPEERAQGEPEERQARPVVAATRRGALSGMRPRVEGPIQLGTKRQLVSRQEMPELEKAWDERYTPEGQPRRMLMPDEHGNPVDVKINRSTTVSDIIRQHFDPKRYPVLLRPMMKRLVDAVDHIAGDTPVHFISHGDMQQVAKNTRGFYDGNEGAKHIVLNEDNLSHDTVLHEAFHAATQRAIEESDELYGHLQSLAREALDHMPDRVHPLVKYAFSDAHEFLTGVMTNEHVQEALKNMKISDKLARDIGIPSWRKATMWEGALGVIRRALGLGPRDTSAIEAAMALTEHAMWTDPRGAGMAMEAAGRMASRQIDRPRILRQAIEDPEAMHDNEKRMPGRLQDMGASVGRAAFDAKDNLAAAALRKLPRWMNGVELSRSFGKMFTDAHGNIIEGIMALGRRKGAELNRRATDDADIISRAHVLADKYPDHQEAVSKLEHDATKFNVRAEETPAQIKGNLHDKAMDNWGHNAHAQDIHDQFNALPKELQDFHIEKRNFYADKAKEEAGQHIDMVLDNFPLPAGETRASTEKMIRENNLTDEAKEHYDNLGMHDSIQADQSKLSGKNVYFNGVRDGNHVVLAKYHMPAGGSAVDHSGSNLPENVREFATRKEAHDYETGTDMHGSTKIKYYFDDPNKPGHYVTEITDPTTGKIVKASAVEHDEKRYQTTLQNEHYEAHDSYADAKRARQKLIDNGLHSVSDVLDKRMEGNWGRINTDAGQAMERRISDRTDLSNAQKRGMIDAARAYGLVSRSGYQSHMMERRNIAGAKYNSADALRSYSNTVNRHIVNKQYAGRMDALMKRLEDKDDANRYTDSGNLSSAVANEIRERVYRNPNDMSAKNAPWVNRLQMMAYMRWLVGPRHLMMMQTHPYAYSAPQMAGRHGAKIYGMLHRAAKDMGGDFSGAKEGVKATFNQARSIFGKDPEKAAQLAATPDVTKDMIGRLTDPEEIKAMTEGLNSGELHSGFGDEFYGASGLKKVDALVKQLSSAQDAQNRAVVYLTAFRAERAKGSSFEKSIRYAKDTVQDTVGVHSSMDVASAMKNPLARMFMQFKQFPLRQIELMSRNVYNGFKGETPEVKREAWKSFAHQVASGFTMAGVHGLPIGLLKPLGLLGMALGITPTPSQIDDRMRRYAASLVGPTGANMLMDGALSAVPHVPDVSNMFSYDLDAAFGEPRGNDWKSYMANQVFGAAGSTLYDTGSGLIAAAHGDAGTALSKLPLPRVVPDFVKALGLAQQGKTTATGGQITPASYEDAAWRMLGFGTLQQQRIEAGAEAAKADIQDQKTTKSEQLKAKQAAKQKAKQTILGVPVTPKNRALLQEREQVYQ
jgi:hypothetical protein